MLIGKAFTFLSNLAWYMVVSMMGQTFIRSPLRQRAFLLRRDVITSRRLLRSLNVNVRTINFPRSVLSEDPVLYVANHVSDLDILALESAAPMAFITSVEVRDQPVVGLLAKLGGCFFVERRNRLGVKSEIAQMTRLFLEGFDLTLFPEGTSSNGEGVLPFKNTLMQAAIDAEATLVPVCINYRIIDGEKLSPANRDKVFYYGDMEFFTHVRALLSTHSIEIECRYLDPIPLTRSDNRKEVARRAHQAIVEQYVPIGKSPVPIADQAGHAELALPLSR
jgi:1-acyl-sn-glycerol-3-phosphate acyltransferase